MLGQDVQTGTKTCKGCDIEKPLSDYYAAKRGIGGVQTCCKNCRREQISIAGGKICEDCGVPVSHSKVKRCQACRALSMRGAASNNWKGGVTVKDGYVCLSGYYDHPNAVRGHIAEHTVVMTKILGRPLFPEENVHHKNGVRDDNRPENLELWSRSQPAGQRVEDKLTWCKEFLIQYGQFDRLG